MDKKFIEIWGDNYETNSDGSLDHDTNKCIDDYTEGMGYDSGDIKVINRMEVGATHNLNDICMHIVIRIR